MATPRKPAATKRKPAATPRVKAVITPPAEEYQLPPLTEAEREAKLGAYIACRNAGISIPAELSVVEDWIAEEQERRKVEEAERAKYQHELDAENKAGPWYVRNGYVAPFSLRLDRQTEKRRIQLAPRGKPGDLHPLEEGDLNDINLKRNVAIGVIEVVPAGEANRIMDHQTTNMGPRVHTPTAILRNAKGEEYAPGAIKTEIEFNQQGVTVGVINPDQMQGKITDKSLGGVGSFGGIQRTDGREVASQFVPTGGGTASVQGRPMTSEEAQLRIADDLARRKGGQGPAAGIGGLSVSVAPVQKA
jgi:hypothetical protein